MPRDPNIPDAFDVYTLVVLRRPADVPDMSDDELDELQARHLAYRADLGRQGLLVANGPFDEQSYLSYRGMSIFSCDPAEAARLSDGDPSVQAGRVAYDVMEWWVRAGALAFPLTDGPVGDRRSMPDDDQGEFRSPTTRILRTPSGSTRTEHGHGAQRTEQGRLDRAGDCGRGHRVDHDRGQRR